MPIQVLFDRFDSGEPTETSYKIINCEVADEVAMVAIDSQFGDTGYTDMFTLVKDGATPFMDFRFPHYNALQLPQFEQPLKIRREP